MKKNNNLIKASVVSGIVLTVLVAILLLSMQVTEPFVEKMKIEIIEEKRVPILVVGDADPGDASGFFYFMIYPHSADPGTDYALNLSNDSAQGGAYEFSDIGNTTCTNETPYSTTFDIILKVGVTNEDGYFTGNQTRHEGWQWILATCADLGISADTNMTIQFIANSTEYAYYHFYLNNGGSGYTTVEGQSFNVTSTKFYVQRIV